MTRSELYALVWAQPMVHVAGKLGLSGNGLAKVCRRHSIPIPGRGHWAKVAAGKIALQSLLPDPTRYEVIPQFGSFGSSELPADRVPTLDWIIPGVLERIRDEAPTTDDAASDVCALRGDEECADKSTGDDRQDPPARSEAGSIPITRPTPPDEEDRSAVVSTATRARLQDMRAALSAECERADAVAVAWERRQATLRLLSVVATRAMDEDSAKARSVLAWVCAVRQGIEADDPVALLVSKLGAGDRPWWLES